MSTAALMRRRGGAGLLHAHELLHAHDAAVARSPEVGLVALAPGAASRAAHAVADGEDHLVGPHLDHVETSVSIRSKVANNSST